MLPTITPTTPRTDWEKDPSMEPPYNPVLGSIRILADCHAEHPSRSIPARHGSTPG
jgi:hypothetical protein